MTLQQQRVLEVGTPLSRRSLFRATAGLATVWSPPPANPTAVTAATPSTDFDVADGHHYTQASNTTGTGFEVRNTRNAAWWNAYRRAGGTSTLGYPISVPFTLGGFDYQLFQLGLLQSSATPNVIQPSNIMEMLDRAGQTRWLRHFHNIPVPITKDGSTSFYEAVRIREGWLTEDAIRARFKANPDPVRFITWSDSAALSRWGLPMSLPEKMGPFVAQRFQRAVLQHWVETAEFLPAVGSVTTAFVGDMFGAAGLLPNGSIQPINSANSYADSMGRTVGERLQAAINTRITSEPGAWSVVVTPLGSNTPWVLLNADAVVPAASLWKIAAMLETYRQRRMAGLNLDELLTMNQSVLDRVEPPATLATGQNIRIRTALERMMGFSDNTTAVLLGDRLGYTRIDETLRRLGTLKTTVNSRIPLTTAQEASRLIEIAVGGRPASWSRPMADIVEMRDLLLSEHRKDRIPARLPSTVRVAHKTGDLARSVHDAGVLYASTGPVTLVIMVDGTLDRERSISTTTEIALMVLDAAESTADGPAG